VRGRLYGYDSAEGTWTKLDDATGMGEWDETTGCRVSSFLWAFHVSRYEKYRVSARAWHDHPGGPSYHPVTIDVRSVLN
jgi:hypothetical protein